MARTYQQMAAESLLHTPLNETDGSGVSGTTYHPQTVQDNEFGVFIVYET